VNAPCINLATANTSTARPMLVCAADAIHGGTEDGPQVTDACFGCGLCALRCPVGAILIPTDRDRVSIEKPLVAQPFAEASESEHKTFLASFRLETALDDTASAALLHRLVSTASTLLHEHFYRLVERLFIEAGFPAVMGNPGDSSNRVDLFLVDDSDSIAVEIKSRTESPVITIKAVQQALENKIVADERQFYPTQRESSTLVVGYDYPPKRSDVTELIDDIQHAFGIRVGLVSLGRLYEMAIEARLHGAVVQRDVLSKLCGPL
jgi:ferredoxin